MQHIRHRLILDALCSRLWILHKTTNLRPHIVLVYPNCSLLIKCSTQKSLVPWLILCRRGAKHTGRSGIAKVTQQTDRLICPWTKWIQSARQLGRDDFWLITLQRRDCPVSKLIRFHLKNYFTTLAVVNGRRGLQTAKEISHSGFEGFTHCRECMSAAVHKPNLPCSTLSLCQDLKHGAAALHYTTHTHTWDNYT